VWASVTIGLISNTPCEAITEQLSAAANVSPIHIFFICPLPQKYYFTFRFSIVYLKVEHDEDFKKYPS